MKIVVGKDKGGSWTLARTQWDRLADERTIDAPVEFLVEYCKMGTREKREFLRAYMTVESSARYAEQLEEEKGMEVKRWWEEQFGADF